MSLPRSCLVVLAFLVLAGPASAATLDVVPNAFSPHGGSVLVAAQLRSAARIGIALADASGQRVGWLSPLARRRTVILRWYGRLGARVVPDGRYRIEIVRGKEVLASQPLTLDGTPPRLLGLHVVSGRRFAGDGRFLATLSPNGDGLRDRAVVLFRLSEPARVKLEAVPTRNAEEPPIWSTEAHLDAGDHALAWSPTRSTPARTYILRLTTLDRLGNRRVYGADRRARPWLPRAPVVRVLGIDAGFDARSYQPGERARLLVETDARALTVEILRSGPESEPTWANDRLNGVPVTGSVTFRGLGQRDGPQAIDVRVGDWPSGLYFVRLSADDGRLGYAPFIVRPAVLGRIRVAVVLPTNTWQAYNFRDVNGDGWGDTWYAGEDSAVALDRPYTNRGVPLRFRSYDLGFLHWLFRTGKVGEFLSEDDLERIPSGDALAAAYDLVVFPGHTEYVTAHEYDVVERYRDLGGNLWFLSANNFFWKVERRGERLERVGLWRELGRPEARLLGVQYLASDGGQRQGPFVVAPDTPAWATEGTGLAPGSRLGSYGIEIDARTPDSPTGTQVIAAIPDLFGPGRSAEMTYYETEAGAKVFAAGALSFGGSAELPAVRGLLDSLWARTSVL